MEEKRSSKRTPEKTRIAALLAGGTFLILLVQKLTAPDVAPSDGMNDYTFQPEPRMPMSDPSKPRFDLGASSGALGPSSAPPAVPAAQAASCASLQQFANYEYARRYRDGKVADLLRFSGFEDLQPTNGGDGVITCSGGEYIQKGQKGMRSCRNVVITYNTKTNTLSYNIQCRYLESGLVAQCS
ncbi:MAG: hypothetical protein ACKO25_02980 [Cyanobium sp.]